MTSPCRITANSGFSGRFFHVFQYLAVGKKNNPLFVLGLDRKIRPLRSLASFMMSNGDSRQGFFCPTLTHYDVF